MEHLDDASKSEASAYPLIVYLHVPKTAGSTITKILSLCTPAENNNVLFTINDRVAFIDLARKIHWIGGHVDHDSVAKGLIWVNRPIEYFSSVREPKAQITSYLNWSFEKYYRSNYYDLHQRAEQHLDADVRSTDYSNPDAVINLLLRNSDLFLNVQSKYVLGADFAEISDDEVARRLAKYTYVANEYDLPRLYRAFGFAQLPDAVDDIRDNVAKYHFNVQVFDSPQLRDFLAHHLKHDLRLYAAVRSVSWSAADRRPFRPAWLPRQVFTLDNFDEQAYLASNPDIAADVERGVWESGLAHFKAFGYGENRMQRRWALPPRAASEQKPNNADFSASSVLERLRRVREDRARIAAKLELPQRELGHEVSISVSAENSM